MENNTVVEPEKETTPVVPPEVTETTPEATPAASQEQLDYKALYQAEKEKLSKAEYTAYQLRKKVKEGGEAPAATVDPDLIREMVAEETRQHFETRQLEEATDILDEEIAQLTGDEDEQNLIRLKYDTRVQKSGFSRSNIRQDLAEAYALANAPKLRKMATEANEALKAKNSVSNTAYGSNVDKPQVESDLSKHFAASDWEYMQKRGFTKEMIKKAVEEKKLIKLQQSQ